MSEKTKDVLGALALSAIIIATLGALVFLGGHTGFDMGVRKMQREAIERGAAEYDRETGDWRWINEAKGR